MAKIVGHNGKPLPFCGWRVRAYCIDCGKVIKGKFPTEQQANAFAKTIRSLNSSAPDWRDPFACFNVIEVYEVKP